MKSGHHREVGDGEMENGKRTTGKGDFGGFSGILVDFTFFRVVFEPQIWSTDRNSDFCTLKDIFESMTNKMYS